jgi:catechol 2,3-dioxygenase-like lactoylglutathione lyase family enzyme
MTTPAGGPSIDRVAQIAINVHDIESAVVFYRDVLGLKLLFKAPPSLAFFDCGGVRLMLSIPEKGEQDHLSSVIYYAVPDIHEAHRSPSARGVSFEDAPHLDFRGIGGGRPCCLRGFLISAEPAPVRLVHEKYAERPIGVIASGRWRARDSLRHLR